MAVKMKDFSLGANWRVSVLLRVRVNRGGAIHPILSIGAPSHNALTPDAGRRRNCLISLVVPDGAHEKLFPAWRILVARRNFKRSEIRSLPRKFHPAPLIAENRPSPALWPGLSLHSAIDLWTCEPSRVYFGMTSRAKWLATTSRISLRFRAASKAASRDP